MRISTQNYTKSMQAQNPKLGTGNWIGKSEAFHETAVGTPTAGDCFSWVRELNPSIPLTAVLSGAFCRKCGFQKFPAPHMVRLSTSRKLFQFRVFSSETQNTKLETLLQAGT